MPFINGVNYTAEFARAEGHRQEARDKIRDESNKSTAMLSAARAGKPGAREAYVARYKMQNPWYENFSDDQVAQIAVDGTATASSLRR